MGSIETTKSGVVVAGSIAACLLFASIARAASSDDAADAERRCGRAVLSARTHVETTDTRILARCALAVLSGRRPGDVEKVCRRLRMPLVGTDLADRRSRKRIVDACTIARPVWLAATCNGAGPWAGRALATPEDLAACVVGTTHCLARSSIEAIVGRLEDSVGAENAENLLFEYGGQRKNSFDACHAATLTSTTSTTVTTTTTSSSTSSLPTTTTLSEPESTTTLPTPTTTVTVPTTLDGATTTTTTTSLPPVSPPLLAITEVMANPAAVADSVGEYFEIKNLGTSAVDLAGAVVRDHGANEFTIGGSLVVAPGGYVVLARSAGAAAGMVNYVYGSAMSLGNLSDAIVVELDGEVVDEVAYDAAHPLVDGRSFELPPGNEDPMLNDAPAAWCASASPMVGGDFGTPGQTAALCAP